MKLYLVNDLSDWKCYFARGKNDGKTIRDHSAIEEAERFNDVITMGKVVITPSCLFDDGDWDNFKKHGFGKVFNV